MSPTATLRSILVLGALGLSACGGGGSSGNGNPVSSTGDVQAIAATTDDTGRPMPINDGAFTFDDTSETSRPQPINAP
ncbi:MAG: hypothetical protein ACT4P0_05535 [Panacagrimonas sp.]